MPVTLVVGGQWGDEGKAKIIDYLARDIDYVVRFQGGANAGHTVVAEGERFAFHLVPSGILYPKVTCILGGGMVIDPMALISEIDDIVGRGINVKDRILISSQAHVVMPYHFAIDSSSESRLGADAIGTTGKGISPAYADKVRRVGIRMGDFVRSEADFEELLRRSITARNRELRTQGVKGVSPKKVVADMLLARKRLLPMITDTRPILWDAADEGQRILCEGAQGALLDIDHGTYPFVTSSSATAGGAAIGSGLPPSAFDRIVGIFKAYCTRVGNGPFPTECLNEDGERLRQLGKEFGTTTGRPRRCGWFDAVAARTVVRLNGITDIALTKLDVLDTFDTVKVCTGYKVGRRTVDCFPADLGTLEDVKPQYEVFEGWKRASNGGDVASVSGRSLEYVRALERIVGCRIHLLSLGPERSAMVKFPRRGGASAYNA